MDDLVTVTIRVKIPQENVQSLIDEWLNNSGVLDIQTDTENFEAIITYVKEQNNG